MRDVTWGEIIVGVLLGLAFIFVFLAPLLAAEYQFKTIAAPGARHTILFGLSDLGDAVGAAADDCYMCRFEPVLYSDGQFYDIGVQGASALSLFGINRDGLIAGTIVLPNIGQYAFIQDDQQTTILDHAQSADAINNRGAVVGYHLDLTPQLAYIWRKGKYLEFLTTKEIPGILGSAATGLNDRGDIVGFYFYQKPDFSFVTQGFIRIDGEIAPLDILPSGINNDGVIVGVTGAGNNAVVLENDTLQLIQYPGADFTYVQGINNKGHLVGYYVKAGQYSGFIAKPGARVQK